jgi:hypothetical protein
MKVTICGGEIQVDAEDRGMVENQGWSVRRRTQHDRPYVQVQRCCNGKWQQLARVLMQPEPAQKVVNLNGDRLDFRKDNLRACTPREARVLGEAFAEKGTSVEWRADRKRWCVRHQINGKAIEVASLLDKDDAKSVALTFGRCLAEAVRRSLAGAKL